MVIPGDLSRREFLKTAPVGLVGLGLTNVLADNRGESGLVVAKNDLPDYLVRAAIRELGGIKKYVKQSDAVVIKPNFSWNCMPTDSANAANTDPNVVKSVVELCLEAGASEIKVVDYTLTNPPELGLRSSQVEGKLARYDQVECKILNDKSAEFEKVSIGGQVGELGFSRDALNADVFINVPKVKNHDEATVSISMKNLMGLIDDRQYIHNKGLHRPIADLTNFLLERQTSSGQRYLVVADAIRALKEGGPGGPGRVIMPECVIAGENPVDLDAHACGLLQIEPSEVAHLQIASEELGLGALQGLDPTILDVSKMSKDDLVPYLPPPEPEDGGKAWAYLVPVGVAVAIAIGIVATYARKAGRGGKHKKRPRVRRSDTRRDNP